MTERRIVLSRKAEQDYDRVVRWSRKKFGVDAAVRYADLVAQALADLQENPERVGSVQRDDLAANVRLYHLRWSRDRVPGERVREPRHFVLYRIPADGIIGVGRILHDRRDVPRHMQAAFRRES